MSATVKVTLGEVESVYRCTYPLARAIEVILHHSDCAEEIEQKPCEDAISRQAAIYACKNGWNKGFDEIMEDIKQLPPVKPEQKWIPVSERLPEKYADVICCTDAEEVFVASYLGKRDDGSECFDDEKGMMWEGEVIAWMPLPKPYEPQESEG